MAIVALIFIRSGVNLVIFGAIFAALSYMRTSRFRKMTGVDPWHIPPVVWAVVSFFIAIFGTLLSVIACATTNVPGRGRGGGFYGGRRGPGYTPPVPPGYPTTPGYPTPGYPTQDFGPPGGYPTAGSDPAPGYPTPSYGSPPGQGMHPSAYPVAPPQPVAATGPPAWHGDPTGRHQHRYWDGTHWTEHVSDNGTAAMDPV